MQMRWKLTAITIRTETFICDWLLITFNIQVNAIVHKISAYITKCCTFSIGIGVLSISSEYWSDFLHRSESFSCKNCKTSKRGETVVNCMIGKKVLALRIPSSVHVNDAKNVAEYSLWALITLIWMWSEHYDICYDDWSDEWKNFKWFTVFDGEHRCVYFIQSLFILKNKFQLTKAMNDVHRWIVQKTIFKFIEWNGRPFQLNEKMVLVRESLKIIKSKR